MSSGVTLKELNRLFDFLKQSKVNDEMTVLITNDMCKSLYDLIENCVKYQDKLQSNWNSLRECIIDIIDGAREELNIIMQDDNLEYTNECSLQFEVIRKNLEIVLDKMNELEGSDKN